MSISVWKQIIWKQLKKNTSLFLSAMPEQISLSTVLPPHSCYLYFEIAPVLSFVFPASVAKIFFCPFTSVFFDVKSFGDISRWTILKKKIIAFSPYSVYTCLAYLHRQMFVGRNLLSTKSLGIGLSIYVPFSSFVNRNTFFQNKTTFFLHTWYGYASAIFHELFCDFFALLGLFI